MRALATRAFLAAFALQEPSASHHHPGSMEAPTGDEQPGPGEHPFPLGHTSRQGSGTSWQPDDSPVRAIGTTAGRWLLMFHWNLFAGYDSQAGPRGDDQVLGIGWLMGMAQHELWDGVVQLRLMATPEPLTVGKKGYPLLLQTGEDIAGLP